MSQPSYQPVKTVDSTVDLQSIPQQPSNNNSPSLKPKDSPSLEPKRDPLYAAMFGSPLGSTPPPKLGGLASAGTSRFEPGNVDTLDEPVIETLKRDFINIREKLKNILLMRTPPSESINDWDLWGPLIMCLGLAISLGVVAKQSVFVFTLVFMLVWAGSLIVTANCRLLGYKLSFFQNVCLLGYGLFPLMCASLLSMLIPLIWILKATIAGVGLGWSSVATMRTLNDPSLEDRKLLAAYPLFLFYFIIFWLILVV